MNTTRICLKCNQSLPADAPEGLCPACLLEASLGSITSPPPPGPNSYAEPAETETRDPVPGTRLGYVGDYELIEEIARGGMGVVYRARQTSLKRIVAVKMIRSGELAGEAEVARFRAEAEAAANLKHPNIVAIHEIGEHEGRHYFSMDYVEGKNLAQFADGKPVAARQVAEWLKAIAEAVQFAHQRGVLHRDLKPQNILVDAEGNPHVTDFGLAKNLHADSGVTQTGAVMGSPSYMAPEQARGRNDLVGPASDVYALGAVLYELLTGRAPFRSETVAETMMRVINSEPTAPSKLNTDVPRDLETICLKCLEKEPSRRYATARDLADDVHRFLRNDPILARPANPLRKAVNWTRRHPTTLAAVIALIALGLVGFAYYLAQENAFLRAQAANPGLERKFGSLGRALIPWNLGLSVVLLAALSTGLWFSKTARRIQWRDLWQPARQFTPMQPVGERVRTVAAVMGALALAFAVVFLTRIIQWQVWEGGGLDEHRRGSTVPANYVMLFSVVWVGVLLLVLAWRDYVRTTQGLPAVRLDPVQAAAIRAAVEDANYEQAIALYRQAVPDARRAEANEYALQISAEFRASDPAKFDAGLDRRREFNWPRLLATAGILAAPGIVLWMIVRPTEPGKLVFSVVCGLVFGIMAMIRRSAMGFWKRILPIAIPMIVFQTGGLLYFGDKIANNYILEFMLGVSCGIFLMLSGYKRRPSPGKGSVADRQSLG